MKLDMKKASKTIALVLAAALLAGGVATAKTTKKKSTTKAKAQTEQVIYTGEIAKKVIGYNGTTPLNITISGGKITKIEALPNQEGPQYLKKATAKVFPQFEGLTVDQALKVKADCATGATYTSEALIKNIQMGLQQAKGKK